MGYPFHNCKLCFQTISAMMAKTSNRPLDILLYCQDCREIATEYQDFASCLADSPIQSEYKLGFLTTEDDPKQMPCTICNLKHNILHGWSSSELSSLSFLTSCYYCRAIKNNGHPNYVREDQRCMAKAEYEGHEDVPDSWGVHHNSEDCESCAYYKSLK